MSQLCAQSIRHLCSGIDAPPLITPFIERIVVNGKSAGISAASYDMRIAHDLVLGPHPGFLINRYLAAHKFADRALAEYQDDLTSGNIPSNHALAVSMERFAFPPYVSGKLADKSSYARMFVSAFNTFFDPGFQGYATIELVNHGPDTIWIEAGDPICQMIFSWLDMATDRPYSGKYNNQPPMPMEAIHEKP